MTVREELEEKEKRELSEKATLSVNSKGRAFPEEPCTLRTCFMRDRDRIIHCKAFRRLKHKTQVFLSPEGDHYRTRLTHTLEVAQIGRTVARALSLNEDLTEAAALGHDLGHTPFGHAGERALAEMSGHFLHNEQSLRVVDKLEKDGRGLNLTFEVRDGILKHTGKDAETPEGRIVYYADHIAYMNHDIDDAVRAGVLKVSDIPENVRRVLGNTHSERINALVSDAVKYGRETGNIGFSPEVGAAADELHAFLFNAVYKNPVAKSEEIKGVDILKFLYTYYVKDLDRLPPDFRAQLDLFGAETVVCDYISGMTDRYAVKVFESITVPKSWSR
ncbi:MAG: deoxyguanosinetriphosphate triphosphohydrolase [Clostridia bacterium]|nr:deoxyguanosinetriphosphate triphosphohydrolase [Clostridia bacterium]